MRLQLYLTELFNTKVKLNIKKDTTDKFHASFEVPFEVYTKYGDSYEDEHQYYFVAHKDPYDKYRFWEVAFYRVNDKGNSAMGITGDLDAKQAIKVFSGVKQAFEIWFKKNDPGSFGFSSKEDEIKRTKIYHKFAKQIASKTGYKLTKDTSHGNIDFMFDKPEKK
jgi:hypothetical protein